MLRLVIGLSLIAGLSQCQSNSGEMNPQGTDDDFPQPQEPTGPPELTPVAVPRQVGWSPPIRLSSFGQLNAIWGSAPDDVWVGGEEGSFFHFDGSAWSRVPSPTKFCIRGLSGSGRRDVWAVTADRCLAPNPYPSATGYSAAGSSEILHWDGLSWTRVLTHSGEITAVAASASDDAWAVGAVIPSSWQPFILRWDGLAWQPYPYPLQHMPTALWAQARNDVWMVSAQVGSGPYTARIQHFDGTSWNGVASDNSWGCGVWASGPNDAWAVRCFGGLLRWDGTTWKYTGSGPSSPYPLWGSGPSDVWSFSETAPMHFSGTTWQFEPDAPAIFDGRGIWGSGPGDIWFVSGPYVYRRYKP